MEAQATAPLSTPLADGPFEGWSPLHDFVDESNRIEGIGRPPTDAEVAAHRVLLNAPAMTVEVLTAFVSVIQPDARLRDKRGLNVRVGHHFPPPGGPDITRHLEAVLEGANEGAQPYGVHVDYETLHPFTDGNGRSGRALWLWQMRNQIGDPYVLRRGFLHTWYYQSLSASDTRSG